MHKVHEMREMREMREVAPLRPLRPMRHAFQRRGFGRRRPSWPRSLAALCFASQALVAAAEKPECVTRRDGQVVCPQPDARCVLDRYGEVACSTPGGGIVHDRYGDPVCGPGHCSTDRRGDVYCSKSPRGAAAVDRYGMATCTDQCVPAKASACVRPVANK